MSNGFTVVNVGDKRARGALLGLAVGDALGTTLEFSHPAAPSFPGLAVGPHVRIVGGGPFGVACGQVTDDTQMAACLAASLARQGGFDAADVAMRYAGWAEHAFDIGSLTAASLRRVRNGDDARHAGRLAWEASGRNSAGNGSLMRTTPIGVLVRGDAGARRFASMVDSAITHFDPRCQLACAAFNAALGHALGRAGSGVRDVLGAAGVEVVEAANRLAARCPEIHTEIDAAKAALLEDLAFAQRPDPELYGPDLHLHKAQGFVRVAFRLAFWELLHAPSLRSGLVDTVNRGGDADTNGAIVGALLGAAHGVGAIPEEWSVAVLSALAGESTPLAMDYHPRVLLDALARFPWGG